MEWLFSWEVTSWIVGGCIATGLALLALDDFKLAKGFFLAAAADAIGGIAMGGTKSTLPIWATNLVVIGLCGLVGFLALQSWRYVDRKEVAKKQPEVPVSFVQLYNIVPPKQFSIIAPGKLLAMNVVFVNKQSPSHNVLSYSGLGIFTPSMGAQKFDDFKKETQQDYQKALARGDKGRDLSIEEQAWNTMTLGPLSEEDAKGLLDGSRRLYFWGWVTWKDLKNTIGTTEVCRWLQKPLTNQLEGATMVWHFCD